MESLEELASRIEEAGVDAIVGDGRPCWRCDVLTPDNDSEVVFIGWGRRAGWRHLCLLCKLEITGLMRRLIQLVLPNEAFCKEICGPISSPRGKGKRKR